MNCVFAVVISLFFGNSAALCSTGVPGEVVVVAPPAPNEVAFDAPPPLVYAEPNVAVVENADTPVYYFDDSYWSVRNGSWYRAEHWDSPWVSVAPDGVPGVIYRDDPSRYRRYRGPAEERRWREPQDYRDADRSEYRSPEQWGRGDERSQWNQWNQRDRRAAETHPQATEDRSRGGQRDQRTPPQIQQAAPPRVTQARPSFSSPQAPRTLTPGLRPFTQAKPAERIPSAMPRNPSSVPTPAAGPPIRRPVVPLTRPSTTVAPALRPITPSPTTRERTVNPTSKARPPSTVAPSPQKVAPRPKTPAPQVGKKKAL